MNPALKAYLDKLHAETRAQYAEIHKEVLEVLCDASIDSINQMPMTCSTDGSNQVVTTAIADELRDAPIAVYPEPVVDLDDKEIEQLTPARATSSIEEVVPFVVTTTDINPKAGVQDLDALFVNTSTPVTREADHGVVLIIPNDLAAPVLTMCSTECLVHDSDWVKPVHLVDKSKNWCMPPVQKEIEQQPWSPPLGMGIKHMGHLFRPRPWPSFKYHSDACYPEERCSGISSQPHEVSWFNPWLVLLLFRNVVFLQVSCCELIPMEEDFSFQSVEILQYIPDDPRLLMWPPTSAENLSKIVLQEIPCNGTLNTFSGDGRAVQQKTCPSENVICWIPMVQDLFLVQVRS